MRLNIGDRKKYRILERKRRNMKIRFKNNNKIFDGSVKKIAQNMLLVQTVELTEHQNTTEIDILTENGSIVAKYEGFETVYMKVDGRMILSNDGSVFMEQPVQELDVEQIRAAKIAEISNRCENTIYEGVDVELTDGSVVHISLTEKDQINLFRKQHQISTGATQLEYHADGELYKYYSAADMTKMIDVAMKFVQFNTIYCNSMFAWIKGVETTTEIEAIKYGEQIPDRYKSQALKDYEIA